MFILIEGLLVVKTVTIKDIKQIIEDKKVAFWGASLFLKELLSNEQEILPNIIGIVDKNPNKQGSDFCGYHIISPESLITLDADAVLMTIKSDSTRNYKTLKAELKTKYPNIELLPNIFENPNEYFDNKFKLIEQDNLNAQIFNNLINNSEWVKRRDFVPIKAAANYSLLCILYLVLEYFKPQKILEFGMGQTSKLTSQYAQNKNKNAEVQIIEHDKEWIDFFSSQFNKSRNVNVIQKDLIKFKLNNTESDKYSDLSDITQKHKYNLIIIDGPIGANREYPRTNILDLIPNNLAKDFIIILDDAERSGELNTAQLIFSALEKNGIKYYKTYRRATKEQLVIASESWKFATIY